MQAGFEVAWASGHVQRDRFGAVATAAPATAPPRATSLPGAEEASQNEIDDILTSAAIVLVSGVAGIAGLMWGRP